MKYSEIRNTLKTGDIVAISAKPKLKYFAGWLVRLFTQSEYSHVGMIWIHQGRAFILEAVHPKVRIVPLSLVLPFYVVQMNITPNMEALDEAFSQVGVGEYSVVEAIKSYFGLNSVNKEIQCVEYVKSILNKMGINITSKDTPAEFVLGLQKLGNPIIFVEQDENLYH
jgi:hypothetical protein